MKNPFLFAVSAWALSVIAMLGSLYFSEIAHYPPCTLCWYQRIAIYPFAFFVPLGIIRKDFLHLPYYGLAIALPGLLVSIYHNLLYYGVIPKALAPCISGVSCTTQYIEWFGVITIPLLSLLTLISITACMICLIRIQKKQSHE